MLRTMGEPASLVMAARSEAGLSRRGLAARAGVPTSTISRIEDGEVDPTFTMLERILGAAGKQLEATSVPLSERPALARLADAHDPSDEGTKVDWTRLRGFIDWLRLHPGRVEESIAAPPPRTGTVLDALLAGMAEKLAADAGLPAPRWTGTVPPVEDGWTPSGTPRMIARAMKSTPEPFSRRNIVLAEQDLWRPGA